MAVWRASTGRGWVELQQVLESMYQPIEDALVASVPQPAGARALDVGCGTGSTTVALARAHGLDCTGVDVSDAMLEAALARPGAEAVRFLCADAQDHPFPPGGFDLVASRFGVMFFADPTAAFANLGAATAPGGALRCVVWRTAEENPFMTEAERAAGLPPRAPGPGQFGFGDAGFVRDVLSSSGWTDVALDPLDVPCTMPEPALVPYLRTLGPLALALADLDDAARDAAVAAVRPAFDRYVDGDVVRFTAACWLVRAARP